MRRDVAKSLNRDHRALHPVLAQDLCGRRPISIKLSFASLDYAGKKKRTKRDVFLAEMAAAVPWSGWKQ